MRYELTDYEWTAVRPLQPHKPLRRSACGGARRVLNGIFWVLRSYQIPLADEKNQNLGGSRARRWYAYLWHEWIVESRRPIAPAFDAIQRPSQTDTNSG